MSRLAVSLFSGAGGMDLGIRQAGFDVLASVELDPFCCETLRANAVKSGLKTAVVEADVRKIEPTELMPKLNLKQGSLDLLFGGPPCQAFSQIGKQMALNDERGLLLFEMVRFASVLKPKAILIEQVKGLLNAKDGKGYRGEVLDMLLNRMEELGYVVKWRVINSADYGVPQKRERVFIVATKKPNGFEFPLVTHGEKSNKSSLFPLQPYVAAGEAIKGLGAPSSKFEIVREDSHVDVTPDGDRRRIKGVPEGSFLAAQEHLPKEQIGRLTKKDSTKFLRISNFKPANTLRCGEIFYHPVEDRYLTPREYMRLHGYPDSYILKGPIRGRSGQVRQLDQHRQIANSVPPPVARLLAIEIARCLDAQSI